MDIRAPITWGGVCQRLAVVSKEGGEQHVPIGNPSGGNSLPCGVAL